MRRSSLGVGGEVTEEGLYFDLVLDDGVDVVGDDVGEFLAFFPEPCVLLGEGGAGGFVVGGPVEIAGEGEGLLQRPFATVEAEVSEVEVGEEVVAEAVGARMGGHSSGASLSLCRVCGEFRGRERGRRVPGGICRT